jgi:anti-sigma regulatory factor (Ser/Thr protein kinase)
VGVATLVASVVWLRRLGLTRICAQRPRDHNAEQYLTRIDFYRVLNAPEQLRFNRHDSSGRFVEVTQLIRVEDCNEVAGKVEAVLANRMHLNDETVATLDFIIPELLENIFNHACSPAGGFLCCQAYPYSLQLAIVDLGRGIEASLAENPSVAAVVREKGPLTAALEARVSRVPERGFGLFWTSQLIKENTGELGIQSCRRRLHLHGGRTVETTESFWPGTAIHLSFKRDKPMDIVRIFNRLAPPEKDFEFIG